MRLFDFAFVPNYPEPLERLKQLADTEYWGRGGRMLKSYFNHMFDKVMDDGLRMVLSRVHDRKQHWAWRSFVSVR